MADLTFVSRRDSSLKEFPPASAQIAMVLPFFGDLTVWIRTPDAGGWHFPTSARRSGETILEVARRELWDAARSSASSPGFLGRSLRRQSRSFSRPHCAPGAPVFASSLGRPCCLTVLQRP